VFKLIRIRNKGNLTYGQFAQLCNEIKGIALAELVKIDKEAADANVRASIASANIKNANANQTAADALKTQSQKVYLQPAQNNTTHCRSYMTGNQMNTNCN
jgi:hypothetical protein